MAAQQTLAVSEAAWGTIQTVIEKGKQIMGVIMSALSSIREIAAGNVAGAANFIERTIGNALPVVMSFAANLLGIGNIGTRIRNLVKGMRQKLGIDRVMNSIMARLKKIVGAGRQVAGQGQDDSKDTPQSLKVKKKVQAYLEAILPATFEAPSEIRYPVLKTANKFRQEGLKYLTINRSKGIFEVSAVASPAKKVAKSKAVMRLTKSDLDSVTQSTKKVGLSKEEMRFTKSDITGFGFGGVTLYASINGVAIDKKFGPIAGVHAETLLINYINNNSEKLLKKGQVNHISIQLSSSPCGEDPQDDKCKNCAGNLRVWAQSKGHTISITFLSLYKGEKNAATTSALKELSESDRVISLEAWDEASVESQIKTKFGGNLSGKILSGLKRKAAAAKKKLEEITGEKL